MFAEGSITAHQPTILIAPWWHPNFRHISSTGLPKFRSAVWVSTVDTNAAILSNW